MDFGDTTTESFVSTYNATNAVFLGLFKEIRELSKKKPEAVMSTNKVKLINRVLSDLKGILEAEPEGKFLDLLDDSDLPQTSDAVLVMVQYQTALMAFKNRYYRTYTIGYTDRASAWITDAFVEEYKEYDIKFV